MLLSHLDCANYGQGNRFVALLDRSYFQLPGNREDIEVDACMQTKTDKRTATKGFTTAFRMILVANVLSLGRIVASPDGLKGAVLGRSWGLLGRS